MPRKKAVVENSAAVLASALGAKLTPKVDVWPDWVESAWHLFMRGQAVWHQLGAKFGVDDKTVKRQVLRFHEAARMGLLLSSEDAHARYIGGLQEIAEAAWADHAACSPKDLNAKAGFLRIAMDAMKNLAAACGVVTERSAQESTFPQGFPPFGVTINHNGNGHGPT